jgi:hypothetical protein
VTPARSRRGGRQWRATAFATVLVAFAVALPAAVLAARSWTIAVSPDELTVDESTAVKLAATNTSSSGSGMECVEVTVSADFEISDVAVLSVNGQSGGGLLGWTAVWAGGSTVAFKSTLGDGALDEGDSAVFRITGTATQTGPMTWTAVASDVAPLIKPACGSHDYPTTSLPFDVQGPAPTPTPTPTPQPTAKATPTPRPTRPPIVVLPSLAVPTLPPILPTARPTDTPRPTAPPTPDRSSDAGSTRSPTPGPTDAVTAPTDAPGGGGGLVIAGNGRRGEAETDFDSDVFDTLSGMPGGLAAWAYPAFVISVPGLLLLLAVAAQALGAFAWLPLIRRRLGEFGLRRARGES